MPVQIQSRDIQAMKFVFACRAVTYDQIARRHFPKTNEIVVRRRIRRLADAGYLKIGVIDLAGKVVRVVQPLPAMWPVISEKWQFAVDTPHFKSESPEHDVRMAEVFMRLEKLTSYRSFFTENLLQSSTALAEDPRFKDAARIQSDGALTVVDAKGVSKIYAVELELSKKTPDRYRQKFIDYYLAHSLDGVLYVSPEREVVSLVARIDQEISRDRDSIVHFAFESSVLSANPKIIFSNREEQKIELA